MEHDLGRSGVPIVLCAGAELHAERSKTWNTGWRTLPFHLLEVADGGAWSLETPAGATRVHAAEVLLVPAGLRHRLLAATTRRMTSTWAYIDWQADGIPLQFRPQAEGVKERARAKDLEQLVEAYKQTKAFPSQLRLQRLGLHLLEAVIDDVIHPEQPDPRIATVLSYIRTHLAEPMDRNALARIADLSETRFHDVFTSIVGRAPMQYVNQVRLQRAASLLITTGLPVSQVADACGFSSPYYFSRLFRQHMGTSPTDFRRRPSPTAHRTPA